MVEGKKSYATLEWNTFKMADTDVHMASNGEIQNHVATYLKTESVSEKENIIESIFKAIIDSKNGSLLTLVEVLSSALTDLQVDTRLNGTSLLADVMHKYEPGKMVEQEVETFITFFVDRLRDHHSIQPIVIYGFLGLTSYQNVPNNLVIKILQGMFAELHVQSFVQTDRKNIFNLFNNLLKTKLDVIKSYNADFLLGFIQAMDGEKDPRNLMICFENARIVIEKLNINLFCEDLFEVLSCYFPIEFTPPKDNPFNTTREDLVLALRQCFTKTNLFAGFAIPLYIDKLSSDLVNSKLDSLETFTICLDMYKATDVEPFITDIWLSLRKDYLLSEITEEMDKLYLKFISSLIKCLSQSDTTESKDSVIDLFIKDCLQTLKDPELSIAKQCSKLIYCLSNISYDIYEKLCLSLVPVLEKSFDRYTSSKQQEHMLFMIWNILAVKTGRTTTPSELTNSKSAHSTVPKVLIEFVDKLLSYIYETLNSPDKADSLKITSLKCVNEVITRKGIFNQIDFNILLDHVLNPLFTKLHSKQLLNVYKTTLNSYGLLYPGQFYEKYITKLQQLDFTVSEGIYKQCINVLDITSEETLTMKILQFLMNALDAHKNNETILLCHLNVINSILKHNQGLSDIDFIIEKLTSYIFTYSEISLPLLNCMVLTLTYSYRLSTKANKQLLVTKSSEILLSNNKRETLAKVFNLKKVSLDDGMLSARVLLYCKATFSQCNIKDVQIDCSAIIKKCWTTSLEMENNEAALTNSAICAASLINKMSKDQIKEIDFLTEELKSKIDALSPWQQNVTTIYTIWLTKALTLNWQAVTPTYIEILIKLLCHEQTGTLTANEFVNLFNEDEALFDKESNSTIKLMYKQRFTQLTLPMMVKKYDECNESIKSNLMIAISSTLKIIPQQILNNYLNLLVPLMMQALATSNSSVILDSTLTTILSILNLNQLIMEEYVTSLVPRLLQICTNEKMSIRILSLKCLMLLSCYQPYLIVPMKNQVVKELKKLLDDKKRLVRREAANCSNAWHLLNNSN